MSPLPLAMLAVLLVGVPIHAGTIKQAGPENYRRILTTLAPGDTLRVCRTFQRS
jgi:hypothetical protein